MADDPVPPEVLADEARRTGMSIATLRRYERAYNESRGSAQPVPTDARTLAEIIEIHHHVFVHQAEEAARSSTSRKAKKTRKTSLRKAKFSGAMGLILVGTNALVPASAPVSVPLAIGAFMESGRDYLDARGDEE